MADYDSSLPIRSEADAHERVQIKIVDYSTPTQGASVDTDGNVFVKVYGTDPAAANKVLRLSELGAVNPDGDYDGTNNTKPASIGIIAHDRNASHTEAQQNMRPTAVAGDNDKHAMDVAISDSSGNNISAANPLPVAVVEDVPGTETHEYNVGSAIAAAATSDHTYSVADGEVFTLSQVIFSGSGKMKVEIQIGDGAASEAFTTKAVLYNSTSTPNGEWRLSKAISVTGTINTTTIKVIRTNRDKQAQDLHSTIVGVSN